MSESARYDGTVWCDLCGSFHTRPLKNSAGEIRCPSVGIWTTEWTPENEGGFIGVEEEMETKEETEDKP